MIQAVKLLLFCCGEILYFKAQWYLNIKNILLSWRMRDADKTHTQKLLSKYSPGEIWKHTHTHTHALACLTHLVLNFCRIERQTGQVAPALRSAEREEEGAGQMALTNTLPHRFCCHSRSRWVPYLSSVRSVQWKSWLTWTFAVKGMWGGSWAPDGSSPDHLGKQEAPDG